MRRLVLVVLMLLLPLQSVWSAAAALCVHEADPTVQHFGHHGAHHAQASHADAADAAAAASDAAPGDGRALPGEVDHHHLSFVHPVPAMPALAAPEPPADAARPHRAERYASRWIAAPDKPPRRLAESVPARSSSSGPARLLL
ncbi:hypothetical protein [Variovorax sp. PvP013]|jgi:hypothetical protein|uniref:hypothetical protein n=1 Tax=Variovorax sp. PvP013 TaxID=3156435 RepID=UPI003D262EE1